MGSDVVPSVPSNATTVSSSLHGELLCIYDPGFKLFTILSLEAKLRMFQGIVSAVMLTVMHGLYKCNDKRIDMLKTKHLQSFTGVREFDRVNYDRVREDGVLFVGNRKAGGA